MSDASNVYCFGLNTNGPFTNHLMTSPCRSTLMSVLLSGQAGIGTGTTPWGSVMGNDLVVRFDWELSVSSPTLSFMAVLCVCV